MKTYSIDSRRINFDQNLVLTSWNVDGGMQNVSDAELLRIDIYKKKLDVAYLQETCGEENVSSKSEKKVNFVFLRGNEQSNHENYGQAFYVSQKWRENFLCVKYISNRISKKKMVRRSNKKKKKEKFKERKN